jgi:transcriptional regulator with XRE-family HTH domain
MSKYGTEELKLLNIQIGCVLRLTRLEKGISQESLGSSIFSDKTKIARLEKFAHATSWDTIYLVSQELGIDFCSLFVLKSKKEILSIVDECVKLDTKLSKMKLKYYDKLREIIAKY